MRCEMQTILRPYRLCRCAGAWPIRACCRFGDRDAHRLRRLASRQGQAQKQAVAQLVRDGAKVAYENEVAGFVAPGILKRAAAAVFGKDAVYNVSNIYFNGAAAERDLQLVKDFPELELLMFTDAKLTRIQLAVLRDSET